jgi:hypothetical protein
MFQESPPVRRSVAFSYVRLKISAAQRQKHAIMPFRRARSWLLAALGYPAAEQLHQVDRDLDRGVGYAIQQLLPQAVEPFLNPPGQFLARGSEGDAV